jgi:hypothetical protein
MSLLERMKNNGFLIWAAAVTLAICLVYSVFYLAIGSVFSHPLDDAVWGGAIFILLAGVGYTLELNTVKGYYRSYLGVSLLVTICGMAFGVVLAILGFVGLVALVPISVLILSLSIVFSPDFFGVDRLPFCLRLLASGLIVGAVIAVAVFLF